MTREKKMQWLKLVPSHIQIEIVDSKGIGHYCKKQDFIVLILIDLISSWKVTSIEVIKRKCSANVYLSKFTLNKNLKFKDFIDVIFIFPRVLKFWFFFFLRNQTLKPYNIKNKTKRNYKESRVTRGAISSGGGIIPNL